MSCFRIDQFSHLLQSVIFTQYFSTVTFSENSFELVALICGRVVQHGKCNESEFWQSRRHQSHISKLTPAVLSGLCCGGYRSSCSCSAQYISPSWWWLKMIESGEKTLPCNAWHLLLRSETLGDLSVTTLHCLSLWNHSQHKRNPNFLTT